MPTFRCCCSRLGCERKAKGALPPGPPAKAAAFAIHQSRGFRGRWSVGATGAGAEPRAFSARPACVVSEPPPGHAELVISSLDLVCCRCVTRRTGATRTHARPVRRHHMNFRPLHDRVVVRRVTPQEKSPGGIFIPDTVKEKPAEGEVVAVGPGARDEQGALVPLGVVAGDRVLFGKWSGSGGEARRRGTAGDAGKRPARHLRRPDPTRPSRLIERRI